MGPSNDQHRPADAGAMAGRLDGEIPAERKPYMLLSDVALRAAYLRIEAELRVGPREERRATLIRDWGIVCQEVNFRGLDVPEPVEVELPAQRHLRSVE